ncbi:MAG: membrane protein insertase YidC [Rhodospirillales bacterium]|nr:membrane protein insertase YidC [Rhodospirillales bacterium]
MDNRNLILAIVLSVAILFGFEMLFPKAPSAPETAAVQTQGVATDATAPVPLLEGSTPAAPNAPQVEEVAAEKTIQELITAGPRIAITSPSVTGSISLTGGRIDDLILNGYSETLDESSPKIRLLTPRGALDAYWAEYGWIGANVKLPNANTVWSADKTVLSPGNPVTLTWDNGEGLTFTRTIDLDKDFMFTVTQRVTNASAAAVTLNPFGLLSRGGTPTVSGLYILHEGPLGVFNGTLKEVDYSDLMEDGPTTTASTGGWIGFTDKYWLTALIPDQATEVNTRMLYTKTGLVEKYQADFVGAATTVAPGASVESTTRLFAGAKRVALLDSYAADLGIVNFDLAIDFGWLYFLTKPIFYALHWLYGVVGNFGIAILGLTIAIKLVLFPLANKSYVSMSKMKKLGPQVKALQAQFKDDKMRLNQEMMALYKKEKANPAAGCLPMLVQIPIFFALYKVLLVTIEMRHAPFYGWIQDLSARDPLSVWTLFGLIPWDHLSIIPVPMDIGVWPLVMGFTMWLQMRLNPQPTDPIQAKMFMYLPFIFTFLLANFSAGLVIYWAWNNTLSILQQWVIMKRMGVKVGN